MSLISYGNLGTNTDMILREVSKGKITSSNVTTLEVDPQECDPQEYHPQELTLRDGAPNYVIPQRCDSYQFREKNQLFSHEKVCIKVFSEFPPIYKDF